MEKQNICLMAHASDSRFEGHSGFCSMQQHPYRLNFPVAHQFQHESFAV